MTHHKSEDYQENMIICVEKKANIMKRMKKKFNEIVVNLLD
jgi:hypothetical protein